MRRDGTGTNGTDADWDEALTFVGTNGTDDCPDERWKGAGYWSAAHGLAARADSSEPTLGSSKNDAAACDRGLGDRDPTRVHQDKSLERRFSGETSWRPEPEGRAQPTTQLIRAKTNDDRDERNWTLIGTKALTFVGTNGADGDWDEGASDCRGGRN